MCIFFIHLKVFKDRFLLNILGNCTCDEGFAGSDCSFDLLGPPNITHISNFGLCDKSLESCDEITLFGKYFIENMQTNCYMQRNTVQLCPRNQIRFCDQFLSCFMFTCKIIF